MKNNPVIKALKDAFNKNDNLSYVKKEEPKKTAPKEEFVPPKHHSNGIGVGGFPPKGLTPRSDLSKIKPMKAPAVMGVGKKIIKF